MIYIATPISEKPEKAGNYQLIENSGSIGGIINLYDPEKFGNTNGGWFLHITKNYKFWLKPVEGVVMTEGEIEKLKQAEYNKGYAAARRLDTTLDKEDCF